MRSPGCVRVSWRSGRGMPGCAARRESGLRGALPPYRWSRQPAAALSGGLALLVEVPSGIPEPVSRGPGVSFLLRQAAVDATAIVCSDDPREIAMWRGLVVDRAGVPMREGGTGEIPRIFCRTSLEEEVPLGGRGGISSRVKAAHGAGADGIVVRLREGLPQGVRNGAGAQVVDSSDVEHVAERLASCFDPWRR